MYIALFHHRPFFSEQDRYAVSRYTPPIDASQDWQLVSGTEEGGATVLEFTRKLINCDDKDLDIKVR